MLSRASLQRQSREKNAQLRCRLQLLHLRLQFQWLLLHPSHQLLSQLRSLLLSLFPLRYLRLHQHLQLPLHQRQIRRIQCRGMNLRQAELPLRLLTTIKFLTVITMWLWFWTTPLKMSLQLQSRLRPHLRLQLHLHLLQHPRRNLRRNLRQHLNPNQFRLQLQHQLHQRTLLLAQHFHQSLTAWRICLRRCLDQRFLCR